MGLKRASLPRYYLTLTAWFFSTVPVFAVELFDLALVLSGHDVVLITSFSLPFPLSP